MDASHKTRLPDNGTKMTLVPTRLSGTVLAFALFLVGLVALGISCAMDLDWQRLVMSLLAATFTNIGLWLMTNRLERSYVGVSFLSLIHVIQAPMTWIICAFFTPPNLRLEHPFPILQDHPLATYMGLCVIPLGIFIALVLRFPFAKRTRRVTTIHTALDRVDGGFGLILVISAVLYLSFIYSIEDPRGIFPYILRILHYSTAFCTYASGYLWRRFPKAAIVWLICIGIYIVYASITGSRSIALIFGGLFTMGWVFSFKSWRQRRKIIFTVALPVFFVFLIFSSIVGRTRVILGRGTWQKISEFNFGDYKAAAVQVLDDFNQKTDASAEAGVVGEGFTRLVQWCNLTIPAMSPDLVSYRGFHDLGNEWRSLFQIGLVTGRTYWANVFSNDYGFYTDPGGSSAYEFGLISDSWSRGGFFAAIFYGMVAAFFLCLVEEIVVLFFKRMPAVCGLLILVIVNQALFTFNRESFLTCARLLILYLLITGVVFALIDVLRRECTTSSRLKQDDGHRCRRPNQSFSSEAIEPSSSTGTILFPL